MKPEEILRCADNLSYEELLAEHWECRRKRWENCDVLVEGDPDSQLALRASLYHLLRSHKPNDSRVAIDAKGAAGDAYFGRYFWDTEVYLLPFFIYTDPQRARTLTDFRINTLGGARRTAEEYGYKGARFPWESDHEGNNCCPSWQYADHEVHVTADVVYGFEHYAAAVENDYLTNQAAETIIETARYWVERVDWRAGEDFPSLLGVMGPDEYTPISGNNAYTNWMVKRHLKRAAEVGVQAGIISREEGDIFDEIADKLPVLRDESGKLILQCEEFERLAEPHFRKTWKNRDTLYANAVSQEKLYRTKCLKQADVLMLMLLFPDAFSDEGFCSV